MKPLQLLSYLPFLIIIFDLTIKWKGAERLEAQWRETALKLGSALDKSTSDIQKISADYQAVIAMRVRLHEEMKKLLEEKTR